MVDKIGKKRIIIAIDTIGENIAVNGWQKTTKLKTVDVVRQLDPYCSEFLLTVVEKEGKPGDVETIRKSLQIFTEKFTK